MNTNQALGERIEKLVHELVLELRAAIAESLTRNAPHLGAIRQVLDQRRRALGNPPALALPISPDPRVREMVVKPHDLGDYDNFSKEHEDDQDTA